MLFNSYEFILIFLPITIVVYFYIGSIAHHRVAISWLVAASLFYYAWWNPAYLSLILVSIFFNYSVGMLLGRKKIPKRLLLSKKSILILSITANLLLLGYFKYANFFVETINVVASTSYNLDKIILPLAISFFTFQQVAYLVDAYKGETKEYNFLHYCLFVSFFPQLIAGPIVHHKQMLPQFYQKSTYILNYENIAVGFTIFIIGMFKKVVIADNLSVYVSPTFDVAGEITLIQGWISALAYTFQLYFDFSGYSDMAIGAARMFGIRIPVNFSSPYKSQSIIEFWRRWHITLSKFLRDYLYIPLGGNRKGGTRKYINLMITMLLGGLWHGAGWTFIVWGGLHGIYLIINNIYRKIIPKHKLDNENISIFHVVFNRLLTFLCIVIAWVFFRAADFDLALKIISSMFGGNGLGTIRPGTDLPAIMLITVSFFIVMVLPNVQQYFSKFEKNKKNSNIDRMGELRSKCFFGLTRFSVAVTSIMILMILLMMQSVQKSEFLYYDF